MLIPPNGNANSTQRIALEDPVVDPITYGTDDNGPPPELQTNNHVTIPQSPIQLTEGQETVLLLSVNPL